jgi:N-acetyl-1-D-myo-inositol-2-amino-2-deoxy-alpha-D-glucopyranoside deacetylase
VLSPNDPPVLLIVIAHPDDETFGTGSVIASAAHLGRRVVVCCATRGELGEDISGTTTSAAELADVREQELRAAAATLGAAEVVLLGVADTGMTGEVPPNGLVAIDDGEVAGRIADVIERVRPDVVVTMRPDTPDDHRDHKRIGAATTQAFERAAPAGARLYYWCMPESIIQPWIGELTARGLLPAYTDLKLGTPDDEITTIVDVGHVGAIRRAGVAEHRTQQAPFDGVSDALYEAILARDHFLRVVPPWDGGSVETSLFG